VRVVPAVVVLAACGRIGFDASPTGFVRATTVQCVPPTSTCSLVTSVSPGPAGDVVLVAVTYDNAAASITSVSDGSSAQYARVLGPIAWPDATTTSELWAATVTTPQTLAVTVQFAQDAIRLAEVWIDEYTATAIDQIAFATGTSGSMASDARTIDRGELVWGLCLSGGDSIATAGDGFTSRLVMYGDVLEEEVVPAGTYSATCTIDPPDEWLALMVTLE
jgi:hypothetical protein